MEEWLKKDLELHAIMLSCIQTVGLEGALLLGVSALQSLELEGDMVEFGSYRGFTAAYLSRLTNKTIFIYDSFQGLPQFSIHDAGGSGFIEGQFAVTADSVLRHFEAARAITPIITKSWFRDLKPDQLPEKISFAHLDGDLYESVLISLQLVYPRLVAGACCFIHDYNSDQLPGAKLATDFFLQDKEESVMTLIGRDGAPACHAFFRKR